MITGFNLIVMSQKISSGDIRIYQANCFLFLTTPGLMMPICHHSGIIQDECSLYFSQPDFQFSWFLVTVDYGWVLGPFIGGLMIISTHYYYYDHIYTCYPRLTNCHYRHKLEYIFSDSKSIIYLFVLTPSVYPPYLLSYQHCSLINRLTFTLSWNSIDIIVYCICTP